MDVSEKEFYAELLISEAERTSSNAGFSHYNGWPFQAIIGGAFQEIRKEESEAVD